MRKRRGLSVVVFRGETSLSLERVVVCPPASAGLSFIGAHVAVVADYPSQQQ